LIRINAPRDCSADDACILEGGLAMFKTNVGGFDRVLRVVIGAVLIALVFVGDRVGLPIGNWGWLGLIPLATGFLRTCPLYSIIGVSSCPRR
jgi:hypothetical protein